MDYINKLCTCVKKFGKSVRNLSNFLCVVIFFWYVMKNCSSTKYIYDISTRIVSKTYSSAAIRYHTLGLQDREDIDQSRSKMIYFYIFLKILNVNSTVSRYEMMVQIIPTSLLTAFQYSQYFVSEHSLFAQVEAVDL